MVFLVSTKEGSEKPAWGTFLHGVERVFRAVAHSPCSRYADGVFTVPFTCQTVFDLSSPPQGLQYALKTIHEMCLEDPKTLGAGAPGASTGKK